MTTRDLLSTFSHRGQLLTASHLLTLSCLSQVSDPRCQEIWSFCGFPFVNYHWVLLFVGHIREMDDIYLIWSVISDQNPEQSTGNYSEDEQNGKQKWREGGREAGRKREREKEENEKELEDEQEKRKRENEKHKQYPEKRLVSKSLMDTLWAKFKLNRCPIIQESLSLSFEFDMTHKQV
nr:NANOG neighbor homeobox [Chlorocebus sabaeus]